MEENDEGNVSLGPDLTEGHRRGCTGALGWLAAWREREKKTGRGGKKKPFRVPSPRPGFLSRFNPPHRKYRSDRRYFRPRGIFKRENR